MGLLMLLLVVMAASSHLEQTKARVKGKNLRTEGLRRGRGKAPL